MVHGTVHLANGDIVLIQAKDMLTALKRATERYQGQAISMDFKTVEVNAEDGGCEVGEDYNGHVRQSKDKAPAAAS